MLETRAAGKTRKSQLRHSAKTSYGSSPTQSAQHELFLDLTASIDNLKFLSQHAGARNLLLLLPYHT